jgi:hypothetical protein
MRPGQVGSACWLCLRRSKRAKIEIPKIAPWRQTAKLASSSRNPRRGDREVSDEWPHSTGISSALGQIPAETGLSGWGGRTLIIVYRFENVSLKCRENVRGSAAETA